MLQNLNCEAGKTFIQLNSSIDWIPSIFEGDWFNYQTDEYFVEELSILTVSDEFTGPVRYEISKNKIPFVEFTGDWIDGRFNSIYRIKITNEILFGQFKVKLQNIFAEFTKNKIMDLV